jgi:hypothetical protein
MAHADPWNAVVTDLTGPVTERPALRTPSGRRPTPTIGRGRPFTARADSIRRLKERAISGRRLYAVTFDDQDGYSHIWLAGVEEDETGWAVRGGAGGAGHAPPPSEPSVNLAGWWGTERFYAGGQVLAAEHVRSVRLTTRDGTILDDDTEGGVVLFLTDRTVEIPVVLELRDIDHRTVGTQPALDL